MACVRVRGGVYDCFILWCPHQTSRTSLSGLCLCILRLIPTTKNHHPIPSAM